MSRRRLALSVLALTLAACDRGTPPPATPPAGGGGGAAAAGAPAPPSQPSAVPAWEATRVSIPVATRTLKEHLQLLDAQSPFAKGKDAKQRMGDYAGFFAMNLDEERRLEWGASGTFWEALLDLCARGGFRVDNFGDTVWLNPGRQKMQGLTPVGPALAGLREIKAAGGDVSFQLFFAFEPQIVPESVGSPAVRAGGRGLKSEGMMGGMGMWGWTFTVPAGTPGPLDATLQFDRPVEFAEIALDPSAGASGTTPDGKGKVTLKKVDVGAIKTWDGSSKQGTAITATESGIESHARWMRLPDGTTVKPPSWQSMGFGGSRESTAEFHQQFPAGSKYVVQVVTRTEKVKVEARIDKLDWDLWTKDIAALQGRIVWPKAPAGETEVWCGVARLDGGSPATVGRSFDLGKLAQGGDDAGSERWWSTSGPLALGVADGDKFPAFRAELLDEGEWVSWVRVGKWLDARVIRTAPAGVRHDVAVDPERAAALLGKAAPGSRVKILPAGKDGTPLPLPESALGDLRAVPVASDGTFRLEGLKPGTYVFEFAGKATPATLKAGANEVDLR